MFVDIILLISGVKIIIKRVYKDVGSCSATSEQGARALYRATPDTTRATLTI